MLIAIIATVVYLLVQAWFDLSILFRVRELEKIVAYLAAERYEELLREASARSMVDRAFER